MFPQGHYIPPLASAILRANARRDSSSLRIPLRGVAIVNGYFDPGVQVRGGGLKTRPAKGT